MATDRTAQSGNFILFLTSRLSVWWEGEEASDDGGADTEAALASAQGEAMDGAGWPAPC